MEGEDAEVAGGVLRGVSGPPSSSVWNPRVFADDARGWQCPFVLCLHPKIKSDTVSTVSPSISHEVMGPQQSISFLGHVLFVKGGASVVGDPLLALSLE